MANIKEELFEGMIKAGFEPLKAFIEVKRIEEDLTDDDIAKVLEVIEYNLCTWADWLRHQKAHARERGNE